MRAENPNQLRKAMAESLRDHEIAPTTLSSNVPLTVHGLIFTGTSLEQSKNKDTLETLFWEWTKRPDIQAQLFPFRDPDKIRLDTVRLLDRELLGIPHPDDDSTTDPAALI